MAIDLTVEVAWFCNYLGLLKPEKKHSFSGVLLILGLVYEWNS